MQHAALIILVKNPIAGKTKTRLAKDVGDARALKMYHLLMQHTRRRRWACRGSPLSPLFRSRERHDDWPNDRFIKLVQVGDGLGERMATAFDHAFARKHDRVVIIGSDCPGVTTELLAEAFEALLTHEVVVGPALDGGYYLLGMRHPHPGLFTDMEWSTDHVLQDTLARAQVQGLSVNQLIPLSDVDHLEDWLGYGWTLPD